ncbi:MAG: SMC-Scp complex subunit ScpB [Erysipelotrichaceae bacterium]
MDMTIEAILEGILFVFGDEGATLAQLSDAMNLPQDSVKDILNDMLATYADEKRGFELVNYNETYKFISKPFVREYVQRILTLSKTRTLSQSALETLAIIAYKQPVTRMEIEEIRGVGCDMMLKKLLAQDLVREAGRAESAGRPILYEITDEFLDLFKLISLDELPHLPKYEESRLSDQLFE